jgi:hypothetical protein
MNAPRELPQVSVLSYWQYKGWDCVWCGKRLNKGAVSAGIAQGDNGAHSLDTEVFACPDCAAAPVEPSRPPKVRKP